MVKNLVVVAVLGWVAWYAYSQLQPVPSVADNTVEGASFNCRKALAMLTDDYNCRDSSACTMTSDELDDLKRRESGIEKNCH